MINGTYSWVKEFRSNRPTFVHKFFSLIFHPLHIVENLNSPGFVVFLNEVIKYHVPNDSFFHIFQLQNIISLYLFQQKFI